MQFQLSISKRRLRLNLNSSELITVISGTNRKNSYSLKVAKEVALILDSKNIPHQILSLEELPNDFSYTLINDEVNTAFDKIVNEKIISTNKFIFVIAEYNGGFPGILKTFIDAVHPKHFKTKKAALIGVASGRGGALRPLDHFTGVLHYLQVEVMADKPKLSGVEYLFENEKLINEEALKRLNNLCDKLLNY